MHQLSRDAGALVAEKILCVGAEELGDVGHR
jgi:hypothetical protein